ncbi:Fanconi anemia group D2 protein-like isoform X2 [Apostichopus japonicus]
MPELLSEVCKSALQTLSSADLEDLPVIVKFILRTVTPSTSLEVIKELRSSLDFSIPATGTSENQRKSAEDSTVILLGTINSSVCSNKAIATTWMKSIEVTAAGENLTEEDILVLLMFHSIAVLQKLIEGLFRKKVRDETLSVEVLESCFENHSKVMKNYSASLLSIAEQMLRSPDDAISAFAKASLMESFNRFDIHYRQDVIGALVKCINGGNEIVRDASLDFLVDLVRASVKEVARFAIFFKKMLEDLSRLSLPQVRKLFSILSGLTFGQDGQRMAIQDELYNYMRKQLNLRNPSNVRIGVIAAITIFGKMSEKRSDGKPCSDGRFKQISSLVKLVQSSCSAYPEVAGLFCDEMSSIIDKQEVDSKVKDWFVEIILNDFQEGYVVDIEIDQLKNEYGLPMEEVYNLETEESQGGIAVNLLPLISKEVKDKHTLLDSSKKPKPSARMVSPVCLAPHFRLLQICIKSQNKGSLEDIDALLGCPLYSFKEEILDKIDSLQSDEKEMICGCIFTAANWFRETINAFSVATDPELKAKVIGRVQCITKLEDMLEKCLAVTPGYKPPAASFELSISPEVKGHGTGPSTSGKTKAEGSKKRKRASQEKENNPTNDTTLSSQRDEEEDVDTTKETSPEVRANLKDYKGFFRELDLDVFLILSSGLFSKSIMDSELHTKEVQLLQLQPSQLEFLLRDLLDKTKHSLTTRKKTFLHAKSKTSVGFSRLDQLSAHQVAKKLVKFLPSLCQHLEATNDFIQTLTSRNDGVVDGPGSTSADALKTKSCFQIILEILLCFFSWDGLHAKSSLPVLEESLGVFAAKITEGTQSTNVIDLSKKCCQYFEKYKDSVPTLDCGVVLLKLMVALTNLNSQERSEPIGSLAETFLKREWLDENGDRCKGAKYNESLQRVIRLHLCHAKDDTLKAIETICSTGVPELVNAGSNSCSTTYPTLTQPTFSSYYRIMFEELVAFQKKIPMFSSREEADAQSQKLIDWNVSVRVMYMLISMIKAYDGRANVTTALKHGRASLEVFMRNGMPALDWMFKTQKEDVQSLLKNLQPSTRALQYMCNHTKIAQDISLNNHVPALKRILEQFVYRVKAMLALHGCHAAMWVGNLKNKDIKGDEIPSQVCPDEEEDESDEEEEEEQREEKMSEDESEDEEDSEMTTEEGKTGDDESCSENY